MLSKKKLLLTAQDYSSGINLLPLYTSNKLRNNFELEVIVAGSASCLFQKKKDTYHLPIYSQYTEKRLKDFLLVYLDKIRPDILMTGIAGFNFGVDEVALLLCKGHISTFSYQDYWGHVNQSLGSLADQLLVLDDFARDLTLEILPSSNVKVVGSLKYNYYERLARQSILPGIKKAKALMRGREYWVFAGQPMWHLKSYKNTLNLAIKEAKAIGRLFFYLPHPSECKDDFDSELKEVTFLPERYGISRESFVLNASKLMSCFSTLSFDILILKEILHLEFPYIAVLFLFDEIIQCHQQHSGNLCDFPLLDKGVFQLTSLKGFQDFLKDNVICPRRSLCIYKNAKNNIVSCLTN